MTNEPQSWAERTVEMSSEQGGFRRGVAPVGPRKPPPTEMFPAAGPEHHHASERPRPSGTGWPADDAPRMSMDDQLRQLRRGSGWSLLGGLFAFVCWGVWAISARGDLTSPVVTFVLSVLVAAGLFALARLLGRVVLERQLGRTRHGARGAHLVTGLFLAGVGVAYLRQTEWVMDVWNWFARL